MLAAKPLGGWLSDRVGRRRLMIALTVVTMAPDLRRARADAVRRAGGVHRSGRCCSAVPLGMALGLQGAMVVEIFPLRTRVTSMSFAYSITLALAGGTAPLVSTWLIDTLGQPIAPAYYIMLYGAIGLAIYVADARDEPARARRVALSGPTQRRSGDPSTMGSVRSPDDHAPPVERESFASLTQGPPFP